MPPEYRLVYFINSLDVGGAEVGMCRLIDGLDPGIYDVTIITLNGQSDALIERIPKRVRVLNLSITSWPSLSDYHECFRLVREADIIIGSLFHSVMVARMMGVLNPSATIATWHHTDQFKSNLRRAMFYRTSRFSDVVLADSESVFEMLVEDVGLSEDLVHTVPIAGIDPDEFTQVTHAGTSHIRVGTVGRVTAAKNYPTVLDVAERLADLDFNFEIAGDGDLYDEIRAEIEKRELTNVSLLGQVDDVPSFLKQLDIYFQPSLWEGLCITTLEAMAAGLPVVGSDIGGISNSVKDGESGYLHDPTDVDGFVRSICILAENPDLRKSFGQTGRRIVENEYTQQVLVSEFESAIGTKTK